MTDGYANAAPWRAGPARGHNDLQTSDAGTGARFALLSAFYAGIAHPRFLAMFLYTIGFASGEAVPR